MLNLNNLQSRKWIKYITPIVLLIVNNASWANQDAYWQCSASDSDHKQWIIQNTYERAASTQAFDACKKQSRVPLSCTVTIDACEEFNHGVSTRPLWQCSALDSLAKTWMSHSYSKRDVAAMAAKTLCEERSTQPDSCYINLFTCKNLHHRH